MSTASDYDPDIDPDLGGCPYYARYRQFPGHDPNGICGGGCVDEPRCITMEPDEGWPSTAVIGSPGLNCQSCGMLPDQQHDEGCPEGDKGPVWPG